MVWGERFTDDPRVALLRQLPSGIRANDASGVLSVRATPILCPVCLEVSIGRAFRQLCAFLALPH